MTRCGCEIAGGVLPTVGDGLPGLVRAPVCLDTSVGGSKEFTEHPAGDGCGIWKHYLTDTDGNESPQRPARTVLSYDSRRPTEEGNLIDISATGETPGEVRSPPSTGGAQRVTVQRPQRLRLHPFPSVRGSCRTNNLTVVLNTTRANGCHGGAG